MAAWKSVPIAGGGCGQVLAMSADRQKIILFSDTQGPYLSDLGVAGMVSHGDAWAVIGGGVGAKDKYRQGVAVLQSTTETGVWYAMTGDAKAGDGATGGGLIAFKESTGLWSLRSSAIMGAGNHTAAPLPNTYRITGHLLVMEPNQGGTTYLWAGTYGAGVQRSACTGTTSDATTWVRCQIGGSATGTWYVRSLAMDPSLTTVYASLINSAGSFDGVYVTTNGHAVTPNFTKLANQPGGDVHDLWLMGGFLYAACGAGGLWRMNTSTGAWSNKSGGFIPGSPNLWTALTGFIDTSSSNNHVILLCNHDPQHDSPATALHDGCGIITTITSAGSASYTDLPAVTHSTIPGLSSTTRSWWRKNSSYHNWWGGKGFFAPMAIVDASTPSAPKWYVTGSEGPARYVTALEGWTMADNGCPMFLGHPVWASKAHAGYGGTGASDWGWIGWSTSGGIPAADESVTYNVNDSPSFFGPQTFCIAGDYFDDTIFAGSGNKYSGSAGGAMGFRAYNNPGSANWANMNLPVALGGAVPMGIAVARSGAHDSTGAKVVVAGISGNGMWRWTSAGGWAEVDGANGEGQWGPVGTARMPVRWAPGTGDMAAYDHGTGNVFYSTDTGQHWYLLVTKAGNGPQYTIAFHPAVRGELWISTGTGLFKITNAHTGPVGGGASIAGPFTGVPRNGPVAYAPAGLIDATNPTLVCAQMDTGSGSGVMYSTDDGAHWKNGNADGSFTGINFSPEDIDIDGQNGTIVVSGSNIVVYGTISTGGSPPVSGAFGFIQAGANIASTSGNLAMYFSEASGGPGPGGIGAPSTIGSDLFVAIEIPGSGVTITPPSADWVLVYDIAASATLARTQLWAYLNNRGGLMGPGPGGAGDATNALTWTASPTTNVIKGKVVEFDGPAGQVTFLDQVAVGGFSATGPGAVTSVSMPQTAGPSNAYQQGLGIASFAVLASPALANQTWTVPASWTSQGFAQNSTGNWQILSQTGLAIGATSVTGQTQVTSGTLANMNSWAGGLATFFSVPGSPPAITTTSPLPGGTISVAYTPFTVTAIGGVPPYSWGITSGALPTGLSISPSTGVISGTPSAAGTFTFTVGATDVTPLTGTAVLQITIAAGLNITTTSLPPDTVGTPY